MKLYVSSAALLMAVFGASLQGASIIMPDLSTAPTGWVIDRYSPAGFADLGTVEGRNNVLGITISTNDGLSSRPPAQQSSFYNTQGMGYYLTGGPGSLLSADLYIPSSWTNPDDPNYGSYRTDIWGVLSNATSVTGYTTFGFTNYGGAPRYRLWDDEAGAWINLDTPVRSDAWTSFGVLFTGSSYIYTINGVMVYTDTTNNGSTHFSEVDMQAYNFAGDPSLPGAVPRTYTALWSNTPVPEPGAWMLLAGGLGILFLRRRHRG